jgi:hypothetical protein
MFRSDPFSGLDPDVSTARPPWLDAQQGDLSPMECLLDVLTSLYDYTRTAPEFRMPAPAGDTGYKTYCGT